MFTKKKTGRVIFLFVAVCILSSLYLCWIYTRDYSSYIQVKHGQLSSIHEEIVVEDSIFNKSWITLKNNTGLAVHGGLLYPRVATKKYPAIILLGGKATGKHAVDYAIDITNMVVLALDYPFEPRVSYSLFTFLHDVPAIRKALIDMVPSTMLAIDYLTQRKDIDTSKIVLLGYSFGAPFVPVIVANDRRFRVAAMVYSGGDLQSLIYHNVRRYEGAAISWFVSLLSGFVLHPLEPVHYIGKISPIPIFMINGTEDEQIPRYNTELLFQAAREPKKLIWIESKHVRPDNRELNKQIIGVLKEEFGKLGIR